MGGWSDKDNLSCSVQGFGSVPYAPSQNLRTKESWIILSRLIGRGLSEVTGLLGQSQDKTSCLSGHAENSKVAR